MKMRGKSKRRVCDSCGDVLPKKQEEIACKSCEDELCEGCTFTLIDGSYCETCYNEAKEGMR